MLPHHPNIKFFTGDILNKESLLAAMDTCEQVYHTAALAKMWTKNKTDFYDVNVTGTKNVLAGAQQNAVAKLVHTSSCGVIGPTVSQSIYETARFIDGKNFQKACETN